VAPFIAEQAEALRQAGCDVQLFAITGHGLLGYLGNIKVLKNAIQRFQPDVVHAHYGLCGLLCTLQHDVPVVVTYHGSDINNSRILLLSRMAMRRAVHNIFVSEKLLQKAVKNSSRLMEHSSILPCGINLEEFPIVERQEARSRMGLQPNGHYVLFAGSFDNPVKNAPLAQAACKLIPDVKLIELKGYSRSEVALLMNAADALLMTSHTEGSPQVVKEAMAVGLPIVSVDVGDVSEVIVNTNAGVILNSQPESLASALTALLDQPHRTNGREIIINKHLDNKEIAVRLINTYLTVI